METNSIKSWPYPTVQYKDFPYDVSRDNIIREKTLQDAQKSIVPELYDRVHLRLSKDETRIAWVLDMRETEIRYQGNDGHWEYDIPVGVKIWKLIS